MLLDTHAHYDDEAFDADRDELLESLKEHGIRKVINAGASVESSYTGLRLAERYPWMYAALGTHPNHAEELSDRVLSDFAELAKHPKVVAIGEIGLEYHYEEPPRDVQKISPIATTSWIWRRRPGFRSSFTPERLPKTPLMRCSAPRRAVSAG